MALIVVGECFGCHELFAFNPQKVPCVFIQKQNNPICIKCVERMQPLRKAKGLPPIEVLPGAYG